MRYVIECAHKFFFSRNDIKTSLFLQEEESFQIKPVVADEAVMTIPTEPVVDVNTVSLVPPSNINQQQRKSSIFKSRANSSQPQLDKYSLVKEAPSSAKGKKGLALYRHTWHEDDARKAASGETTGGITAMSTSAAAGIAEGQQNPHHPSPWDDLGDESEEPPPKLARVGVSTSNAPATVPQKLTHSTEPDEDDAPTEGSGSFRCSRKVKDYYTVVRNVKKAHQIQESGEFQEFNDDVDYILDALQDRNPTATR